MRDPKQVIYMLFFLALVPYLAIAQSPSDQSYYEEKSCGTDEHHAYKMKTDAAYKASHLRYIAKMDSILQFSNDLHRKLPPQYTIPVVVHIIHLGESIGTGTNISDAQILEAIDGLNDRYANSNGMGTDIEINFCLANRDPNGCPTSGINRVDGSNVPLYAEEGIAFNDECGANEIEVKDLIKWPTWQYYNIWVVHDICGDIAGYAYYPNGNEYDGTVIDIASMTYSSRTLAHELGHGLNLQHTFSGDQEGEECPEDANCAFDGDEICDTPAHKRNDCGLNNPCGSSNGEWLDSRYNWMSYCSTTPELGRFTMEQSVRMRASMLEWPRNELLASEGCANAESMIITSDDALMCSGEERELTATPEGGIFFVADGPGVIVGNVLTSTGGGTIVVEYVVSQEECSSSVFQAISTKQAPTSVLKSPEDSLCVGQSVTLTGLPSGGTYTIVSGPGFLDGNILTVTDVGEIEILYEVFVLGCFSRDDTVIVASEWPTVEIESLTEDVLIAVPEIGQFQWVRCDLDYEVIEGANESIYDVSTSGSYAAIMKQGACSDTSNCIEMEITSILDGSHDNAIRIYPNPVHDVLYLEYDGVQARMNIILSDMQGKRYTSMQFASRDKTGLNFDGFASGIYLMTIEVEGIGRYYYRFTKV